MTFKPMRLAVVGGTGTWGQNIVAAIKRQAPDAHLYAVAHKTPPTYGQVDTFKSLHEMLSVTKVDAVFIASPEDCHARQLYKCFLARVPTFIEKPMCLSLEDGYALSKAWEKTGRSLLLVNHIHLFNPGFMRLKQLCDEYGAGADRINIALHNWGPFRQTCSPLWDYGAHAVALALKLAGFPWVRGRTHVSYANGVTAIAATGTARENVQARLLFAGQAEASILVGNNIPAKTNRAVITTHGGFVLAYDDVAKYLKVDTTMGDELQAFDAEMPLDCAVRTFIEALKGERDVITDVRFGMQLPLEVTRVLDAIDECLEDLGEDRPQRVMQLTAI